MKRLLYLNILKSTKYIMLISLYFLLFLIQILKAIPDKTNAEGRYLAFFKEVVKLTAKLVAQWQCVGFCHG